MSLVNGLHGLNGLFRFQGETFPIQKNTGQVLKIRRFDPICSIPATAYLHPCNPCNPLIISLVLEEPHVS
jgi:hypothetical protein